jgi:hypothetical protein
MLQQVKKLHSNQIENSQYKSTFADIILKEKNIKSGQWGQLKQVLKDMLNENLYLLQKMDGISLWKINWKLNRLADKGISREDLRKGMIAISLPSKSSMESTSSVQKALIEKMIDELEGFENLRLSQFYHYKVSYMEKKETSEISRWIEIEISES